MSLDFNLTKIVDKSVVYDADGKLRGLTEGIIWYTMVIDMGEITKKNFVEFATRVRMHHQALGPLLSNNYQVTPRDIERHIGLKTNVPERTKKYFAGKLGAMVRDRVSREIEKEAKTPLDHMGDSLKCA